MIFSPWLRRWTILTAIVTVVLLALGGVVTTFKVGMADPIWPTVPWHLALIDWTEPGPGFLIEHVHRLAGYIVGVLVLVQTFWLWLTTPSPVRRWAGFVLLIGIAGATIYCMTSVIDRQRYLVDSGRLQTGLTLLGGILAGISMIVLRDVMTGTAGAAARAVAVAAYVGVILQGMLGGLRVFLNAWAGTDLAAVHGTFAQVVFALLVALCVLVSPHQSKIAASETRSARRLGTLLVVVVFVQLLWGAIIRHAENPAILGMAQRLHLLTAFVVAAVIVWVVPVVRGQPTVRSLVGVTATLLAVLLVAQVALGVEAWIAKFSQGVSLAHQAAVRTGHVLVGSFLLAAAVALTVKLVRATARAEVRPQSVPARGGLGVQPVRPVEEMA